MVGRSLFNEKGQEGGRATGRLNSDSQGGRGEVALAKVSIKEKIANPRNQKAAEKPEEGGRAVEGRGTVWDREGDHPRTQRKAALRIPETLSGERGCRGKKRVNKKQAKARNAWKKGFPKKKKGKVLQRATKHSSTLQKGERLEKEVSARKIGLAGKKGLDGFLVR